MFPVIIRSNLEQRKPEVNARRDERR